VKELLSIKPHKMKATNMKNEIYLLFLTQIPDNSFGIKINKRI